MSKSKNDIAWEKIFEKYCILDKLANNERVSISSTVNTSVPPFQITSPYNIYLSYEDE